MNRSLAILIMAAVLFPQTLLAVEPEKDAGARREAVNVVKEVHPEYDEFYSKHASAMGIHIASSEKTPDAAIHEAAYLIDCVLAKRDDIAKAIAEAGVHLAIMAHTEFTTDIPEHSDLEPAAWWDRRARGLGATPRRPAFSAGAENLLGYPGDPYRGENILIHEFAHVIHQIGLNTIDPGFNKRLERAYENAREAGLWKGTYALQNAAEYWAEGVQVYFECNPSKKNKHHGEINLRRELKDYDPALFKLLDEVFVGNPFKYVPPAKRPNAPHLTDWDFDNAPTFVWPDAADDADLAD